MTDLDKEYDQACEAFKAAHALFMAGVADYPTALHKAMNAAEWARLKPTHDFARYATNALRRTGFSISPDAATPGIVSVTSPSGAVVRCGIAANKEAILAEVASMAENPWAMPDTSLGSTGGSWWDE